jgi:acetyl-CoA carboxylase biotin carboxyl carrier protein
MSAAPSASAGAERKAAEPAADESKFLVIKSPMVGTFYAAANPESPSFVKVGDRVGPETTVCIVEAMKVFNEMTPSNSIWPCSASSLTEVSGFWCKVSVNK